MTKPEASQIADQADDAHRTTQHDTAQHSTHSKTPKIDPPNVNTSSNNKKKKSNKRKCSHSGRPKTAKSHCTTQHALLDDACNATRMTVHGLLPRTSFDEDGKVRRDIAGDVQFYPVFARRWERGAKWTDEMLQRFLHGLPTLKHARVLFAVQAMTNPFVFSDCEPLGTFDDKGNFIPEGDDLPPPVCRWSVPTLCVRIPDLSFENVSRYLHPSMKMVHGQMKADAERSGMMFGGEEDELHVEPITEAEFDEIVAWFDHWGLLHVTDAENGTRPARLNPLSMAQCTPTMKSTLLHGAPVQGVVTPLKVTEEGYTSTGDVARKGKETHGGITWYRRRNKELVADKKKLRAERDEERTMRKAAEERVERQSELIELQEQVHAENVAQKDTRISAMLSLFDEMARRAHEIAGRSDLTGDEKFDALASAVAINDTDTNGHVHELKEQRR